MDLKLIESIGSQNIERLVQFRVKPDVDLLKAIEEVVKSENIRAGVIVSGLGALKKAIFRNLTVFPKRYPVTPEDRLYREITAPMELVSLGGWIAPKTGGGAELHVDYSVSTVENATVVAILVIGEGGVHAVMDGNTSSVDIFWDRDHHKSS